MLIRELKRRANRFLAPSFGVCAIAYFSYHLIQGNRGIFAWKILENQQLRAQERLGALKQQEINLENRVKLLRPGSICADLLAERAKDVLGYVHPHEVVVHTKSKFAQ
jgi:cell division protein FtsB